MCDPRPGARCSADTAKELLAARDRYEAAAAAVSEHPDDAEARRRLALAADKLTRKSDAYDSSPRGQADLRGAIDVAADVASTDALRTRLAIGRITRIDQKRALARSRGGTSVDENREAAKALRRLRHPEAPAELGRGPALGFFVVVGGRAHRHVTAEAARAAAVSAGAYEFYDAQTGETVPVGDLR